MQCTYQLESRSAEELAATSVPVPKHKAAQLMVAELTRLRAAHPSSENGLDDAEVISAWALIVIAAATVNGFEKSLRDSASELYDRIKQTQSYDPRRLDEFADDLIAWGKYYEKHYCRSLKTAMIDARNRWCIALRNRLKPTSWKTIVTRMAMEHPEWRQFADDDSARQSVQKWAVPRGLFCA